MNGRRAFATGAAPALKATGTAGAPHAGRFVGVTAAGAPASGSYGVGDFCISRNGQMFICVTAGTPGTWVTPADVRNLVAAGEESIPRYVANVTTVLTGTQAMRLTYFTARKTETTTQVRVASGAVAAAATPTLCRIGLYLIDDTTGDGTLVAATANDTALFAATNTSYTKTWTTPYAKAAGRRFALAVLVVSAATLPQLVGGITGSGAEAAVTPRLAAQLAASDLPASFTAASLSTTTQLQYGAILP